MKLICTVGPSSNKPEVLKKLKDRGVTFFRINLSHTEEHNIERIINDISIYGVPVLIDTEGSQVRSGNESEIDFKEGSLVKIYKRKTICNDKEIFLNPPEVSEKLKEGDIISIDFNSLLLRVSKNGDKEYIECRVLIGGKIGGKKAVHIESPYFSLPPFSKKDQRAIEIAKKYAINHFTLSFMEQPQDVLKFRHMYPEAIVYSKIESKKGLENFLDIAKVSDGILIDRGDLSSQVHLEKIPLIQKFILKKCRELSKEAFVATNTLEQMAFSLKPNRAEVNDIVNTILDGATGIALTKETAVGKYPVETINMMNSIINQINFINDSYSDNLIDKIEETDYLNSLDCPELLIKPHGGLLVNKLDPDYQNSGQEKNIEIDDTTLMDMELIAIGAFSPLEGFMGGNDFNSVVNEMKLSNGVVWPLPIVLSIDEKKRLDLKEGETISLTHEGEAHGILHLKEIYKVDKQEAAKKIFGTLDISHPGVKRFLELGDYFLGGEITLLKRKNSPNKVHELTPKQSRKLFEERGWSKVLGFHTRNVIHRSHEFIQLEGLKIGLCDGLFVHPVIGKKKSGDFESEVIVETYEKMFEKFYPKSLAVFGTLATYSRYAGPREALFTALIRKNFGCSHFIVGRDHTGVKDFYHPNASHKIFEKFSKEEVGIIPVKFDKVYYSEKNNRYVHSLEENNSEENKLHISGTEAREILKSGNSPPEWFMRPEISEIISGKIKQGKKVFVD